MLSSKRRTNPYLQKVDVYESGYTTIFQPEVRLRREFR